jgi:hypothetical protein
MVIQMVIENTYFKNNFYTIISFNKLQYYNTICSKRNLAKVITYTIKKEQVVDKIQNIIKAIMLNEYSIILQNKKYNMYKVKYSCLKTKGLITKKD